MTRGEAITRQIRNDTRDALQERNPLQKAYDSYHDMERERDSALNEVAELSNTNNKLLTEINMLREALERSEADRIRFQSISSTLLGRLLAINDCIAGAVKASLAADIDPPGETEEQLQVEVARQDPMGGFSEADREAVERFAPKPRSKTQTEPKATPEPPMVLGGVVGGGMPEVDWSLLPRGQRQPS